MNAVEFDQLLTFWTLKGKITHDYDNLGRKTEYGQVKQFRRLQIRNKEKFARVVYVELLDDNNKITGYEIEYADITENGISALYTKARALTAIQDL